VAASPQGLLGRGRFAERAAGTRGAPPALVTSFAAAALACPRCATALEVRASVFDDRFWAHLSFAALPLLVMGMIAAVLYRIGIKAGDQRAAADRSERTA
jgi:hypothetical protein